MKRERGHAMLELALSAGVLLACLSGTFQFGYTFYTYNQLVSAVGNGGRYASLHSDDDAVRNMVVYGDPRPGVDAAPVVPNLRPEQIEITRTPETVNVAVMHYKVDAVFGAFEFNGRPSVQFPVLKP